MRRWCLAVLGSALSLGLAASAAEPDGIKICVKSAALSLCHSTGEYQGCYCAKPIDAPDGICTGYDVTGFNNIWDVTLAGSGEPGEYY